ncbi:MAG TPA: hypothetical protein VHH73_07100 [Verrucomicrobiae bacterium]|nr:hypothetical protein [Verrucomicrobiae bacterium]
MCEHSLPQLELLATAAARDRANRALLTMQTNHAAIAACASKEGHAHFLETRAALLAQAEAREDATGPSRNGAEQRRKNRQAFASALKRKS